VAQPSQISAYISEETREALEQYVEAHGLKKGHVVEMALLHHLAALRELPADLIIPPRLLVTPETGSWLLELMEHPPEPTEAMRALFAAEESPPYEPSR
jgi:antitoxin component of RelBE/YafQ-DinJ toxin-antitoxin module